MSNCDVISRSPQKVLGDLSNNSSSMHSKESADDLKTETNAMSTSLPMESPMKGDPNAERTFAEIRQAIDPALLAKICDAVHHDKSNHTLEDEVEEVVEEVLTQFHPNELILFKFQGQPLVGTVDSSEKRGALRFYHMKVDGKKYPNRLDGSTMKRKFTPSEKDIRTILENVTEKEPGKPWQVKAEFREEFGIKDKFASIFCSTPKAKKSIPTTTEREQESGDSSETDDEVVPVEDRRLSGLAPSSAKTRKVIRTEKGDKKEKKVKEPKPPKEPKEKKEKKEKKEPKEKKAKNGSTGLKKFVTSSPAGSNTGSPFLSPQKRGEKRFNAAVEKLTDAWKKRDYSSFLVAATSAAKVLNGTQIESIPNECHRFAVRRVFNREKDKEMMKKLPKDKKKDFRDRMTNERKALYKTMDAKIKNYFSGKQEEDDLCIDASELSVPGRALDTQSERGQLFGDCFMITQFIRSLRQFIDGEGNVSAENLLAGLHEGRPGYMKHTVKVLISLLNTLIQDEEYKKYTHFDARLNEFSVQDANVSEVLRAFLIGKTKKDKASTVRAIGKEEEEGDEAEEKEEDGQEHEDDEAKDELNMSQVDVEEQKSIMDQFTADKEMWQLPPAVQLALLRNLVSRILDLSSCNDFLSEDSSSEEAKNMKQRIVKLRKQVEDWEKEMASLPQFDESVDESLLSRTQTRERAEAAKKKDSLERKIEDQNDKIEELVEKVEMEKIKQAQSKRFAPVGMDRHFRHYYWVHQKTSDAGIWIQDFGVTPYENYVRECVSKGVPINREAAIEETKEEEKKEGENGTAESPEITCENENTYECEKWYHIDNADTLATFVDSLKNGPRERVLKKFFTSNLEAIQRTIRLGSRENTQSPDPEEEAEEKVENGEAEVEASTSNDSLDDLKATVVQLASDLRDGYLTTIDLPAFEAKIVSSEKLKTIKDCILELVDTINSNNIIVKLDMKGLAIGTGAKSWFMLDKWKVRLSSAANASAIHLLLSFLDSRINWKNSVTEKRCSCCGSKRSPDCKIACDDCSLVVHYYCTRPKLQEKPTGAWSCAACSRQTVLKERRAAAVRKVQYVDESSEEEEDDEEDEEEKEDGDGDNYDEEGTESDDDAFAAKNKNRGRKRVLIDSDYEDNDEGEEEPPVTKKRRNDDAGEDCYVVMEKIKAANRMYRCLQTVPVPRGTRKCAGVNLEHIEKNLDRYKSYESFVADLHKFFTAAKEYFENHNERKLEEFEELVISLDLPETKK